MKLPHEGFCQAFFYKGDLLAKYYILQLQGMKFFM